MKKLILLLFCIYMCEVSAQTIFHYRYWFDNDTQNATIGTTIDKTLKLNANTQHLSPGIHTFNYQVLNNGKGESSVCSSYFIHTINANDQLLELLVNGKPFNKFKVTEDTFQKAVLTIDTNQLKYGLHTMQCRLLCKQNNVSSVASTFFMSNQSPNIANMLANLQLDNKQVKPIEIKETTHHNTKFTLDVSEISNGLHTLTANLLTKDSVCTSTSSRHFLLDHIANDSYINYHCWIDDNNENILQHTFTSPQRSIKISGLYEVNPHAAISQQNFVFALNEQQPMIYPKSVFHFCTISQKGNIIMQQSDFEDISVSENVTPTYIHAIDSIAYLQNKNVDKYGISWFCFYAEEGCKVTLSTNKECTLQVFEPIEGKSICRIDGYVDKQIDISTTGTHYIALYDTSDRNVEVYFFHSCSSGNCTAIQPIQTVNSHQKKNEIYDLQGRKLHNTPTQGVYIINNKKVIVR